jgi:hypothetical protein
LRAVELDMAMDKSLTVKGGTVIARAGAAGVGALLASTLGPEGAAATAEVLAQAGESALEWIDDRRGGRVARTLTAVSAQVAERRAAGEIVREDFADPENGDAAALFEAVVVAAADSAEDRKCAVVANLYASLAFDTTSSIDDALLYVRRIRDASWRQLVALQYLKADSRSDERESAAVRGDEGEAKASATLAAEMEELAETLGLIGVGQSDGSVTAPTGTMGGGGFYTSSLARWKPTAIGRQIASLGRLAKVVADSEVDDVARRLAEPVNRS